MNSDFINLISNSMDKASVNIYGANPTASKKPDTQRKSKSRPRPEKSDKVWERKHNVVIVRSSLKFRSLVFLAKNMLRKQFDTIELHAIDDYSYSTAVLAAQCLMKHKYVTMTRLKTKTVQTLQTEEKEGDIDKFTRLQPRLVVHLTKTAEFDSIYDDFENRFKQMVEAHDKDIAESEAPVQPSLKEQGVEIAVQE